MGRRRHRRSGARVARAGLPLALLLAGAALSACETTAEKSARLGREAKHVTVATKGLQITRESTDVKVLSASIVKGSEGTAVVVELKNRSSKVLLNVPIAIAAKDASGKTVYENNAPGLEKALVSVSALAPHATIAWVDDQLPATTAASSLSARVGAVPAAHGKLPALTIGGAQLGEAPANGLVATGRVTNHSSSAQASLVVYAVARRGPAVVAAGRGVLPQLAAGASAHFEAFMVGSAAGAKLQVAAPPTSGG